MILTGKSLNAYGIKSADLEEKRKKKGNVSENMSVPTSDWKQPKLVIAVAEQLAEQSARHLQLNFSPSALSRCHFKCRSH